MMKFYVNVAKLSTMSIAIDAWENKLFYGKFLFYSFSHSFIDNIVRIFKIKEIKIMSIEAF